MKKKYQKPETEIMAVEIGHFICVSGEINEWSLENDESDDDDWSDDNSNKSKSINLWER